MNVDEVSSMLTICKITEQERPSLRAMAEVYWQEIFPHSPVVHDPAYRARYFEGRFPGRSDDTCQWWAKVGEEVVGFASVQLTNDDAGDMVGCIKDFYISRDRRRQGYGAALAERLFQWLHGQGARRVSLRTRIDSPAAVAFWRSVGCEPLHYEMRRYFE